MATLEGPFLVRCFTVRWQHCYSFNRMMCSAVSRQPADLRVARLRSLTDGSNRCLDVNAINWVHGVHTSIHSEYGSSDTYILRSGLAWVNRIRVSRINRILAALAWRHICNKPFIKPTLISFNYEVIKHISELKYV